MASLIPFAATVRRTYAQSAQVTMDGHARMTADDASRPAAALRSFGRRIGRLYGLHVVTTRLDSWNSEGTRIYQLTLGRPAPGGGYSVHGEAWVYVYDP